VNQEICGRTRPAKGELNKIKQEGMTEPTVGHKDSSCVYKNRRLFHGPERKVKSMRRKEKKRSPVTFGGKCRKAGERKKKLKRNEKEPQCYPEPEP